MRRRRLRSAARRRAGWPSRAAALPVPPSGRAPSRCRTCPRGAPLRARRSTGRWTLQRAQLLLRKRTMVAQRHQDPDMAGAKAKPVEAALGQAEHDLAKPTKRAGRMLEKQARQDAVTGLHSPLGRRHPAILSLVVLTI